MVSTLTPLSQTCSPKSPQILTGRGGTALADPLYGFEHLSELYLKASPSYTGRYNVPVFWNKKYETIVSNESSEIICIFYSAFDSFLLTPLREESKSNGGLLSNHLKAEIEEMSDWLYSTTNNGVYKAGFATSQGAYEESVMRTFALWIG